MKIKQKIHIVGAGFSGLSLAYHLSRSDRFEIEVFEKSDRVGGMINTLRVEGHLVEEAAPSVLATQSMLELMQFIGIEPLRPRAQARKRFFYREVMRRWPLTVLETLLFLPRLLKVVALREFFKVHRQETLFDWGEKKFGEKFAYYVLSPAFQGVYGLSARLLNASLLLRNMQSRRGRQKKYGGIFSSRNGMLEILQHLHRTCARNGVKFYFSRDYDVEENSATKTILCTSAREASQILRRAYPDTSAQLDRIQFLDLASLHVIAVAKPEEARGFGCLVPPNQNLNCLGVLFNSDIFDHRGPLSSETYIFNNAEAKTLEGLSPSARQAYVVKMRRELFRGQVLADTEIKEIYLKFWPQGLPIYNEQLLAFQDGISLPKNIFLHGNYVRGIGLSHILENSIELAGQLEQDYT